MAFSLGDTDVEWEGGGEGAGRIEAREEVE